MRRDENIIPLSRDHHSGLLCCWKIRQGLKTNVDLERIQPYVIYFWKTHLQKHFYEEENILFVLKDDAFCEKAIKEHREIEQSINEIAENRVNKSVLEYLADLLEQHIRYEERELFPYLEQKLTVDQLSNIGVELSRLHETANPDDYKDAFWERLDH